jgi:hypothetical protein
MEDVVIMIALAYSIASNREILINKSVETLTFYLALARHFPNSRLSIHYSIQSQIVHDTAAGPHNLPPHVTTPHVIPTIQSKGHTTQQARQPSKPSL